MSIFPQLGGAEVAPHTAPSGVAAGTGAGQNLLGGLRTGYQMGYGLGQGVQNLGAGLLGEGSIFGGSRKRDILAAQAMQEHRTGQEKELAEFQNKLAVMRPMDTFNHMMSNKPEWVTDEDWQDMMMAGFRTQAAKLGLLEAEKAGVEGRNIAQDVQNAVAKAVQDGVIDRTQAENLLQTEQFRSLLKTVPEEEKARKAELEAKTEEVKTRSLLSRETRGAQIKAIQTRLASETTRDEAEIEMQKLNKEYAPQLFDLRRVAQETQIEYTDEQIAASKREGKLAQAAIEQADRKLRIELQKMDAATAAEAYAAWSQMAHMSLQAYANDTKVDFAELDQWSRYKMALKANDELSDEERRQIADGITAEENAVWKRIEKRRADFESNLRRAGKSIDTFKDVAGRYRQGRVSIGSTGTGYFEDRAGQVE